LIIADRLSTGVFVHLTLLFLQRVGRRVEPSSTLKLRFTAHRLALRICLTVVETVAWICAPLTSLESDFCALPHKRIPGGPEDHRHNRAHERTEP
jgi:hypothetical protein